MMENGKMVKEMDMEFKNGWMVQFMKVLLIY